MPALRSRIANPRVVFLVLAGVAGYWFLHLVHERRAAEAKTRAYVWFNLLDRAGDTESQRGRWRLFGSGHEFLAEVHPFTSAGVLLAVDPDPAVGDCQQYSGSQAGYASCMERHATWCSTWAPLVRTADLDVGACRLGNVPVGVQASTEGIALEPFMIRHGSGPPHQFFRFDVHIDSGRCVVVSD